MASYKAVQGEKMCCSPIQQLTESERHPVQLINWLCLIPEDDSSLAQQNVTFMEFVPVHTIHIIPCRSWKTLYTPEHHQYFIHLPGNTQELPVSSVLIYAQTCKASFLLGFTERPVRGMFQL